jgi:hypothetical protein
VIERHEVVPEYLDVIRESGTRFRLGEPDRADRRMAEDDGRDQPVVKMAFGLAAEQAIREPPSGRDRDGREFAAAGHVADRMDADDIRILAMVCCDLAARA